LRADTPSRDRPPALANRLRNLLIFRSHAAAGQRFYRRQCAGSFRNRLQSKSRGGLSPRGGPWLAHCLFLHFTLSFRGCRGFGVRGSGSRGWERVGVRVVERWWDGDTGERVGGERWVAWGFLTADVW